MDPLTALSLTGTVIQFVDFGSRLLSQGRQLYNSADGKLTANEENEVITRDLHNLIKKLRQSISSPEHFVGGFTQEDLEQKNGLELICDRAATVAEEIIVRLNELVIPEDVLLKDKRWRKLKTFQQVLKSGWSSGEIASLLARLGELRKSLDTNLLYSAK